MILLLGKFSYYFILRDLCVNMNNHLDNQQSATFHQLGYFIKALLGLALIKYPI
ncbi:hypothetical protein SPBRAN_1827 [uncultured Candidatus Thioglobus sp.]|nr:hypothetical protein SPBRAN_1827 [uncultured Candidatus Thioglobus sp.]